MWKNQDGIVMDASAFTQIVNSVTKRRYDGHNLNEYLEVPTFENLALAIYRGIAEALRINAAVFPALAVESVSLNVRTMGEHGMDNPLVTVKIDNLPSV